MLKAADGSDTPAFYRVWCSEKHKERDKTKLCSKPAEYVLPPSSEDEDEEEEEVVVEEEVESTTEQNDEVFWRYLEVFWRKSEERFLRENV